MVKLDKVHLVTKVQKDREEQEKELKDIYVRQAKRWISDRDKRELQVYEDFKKLDLEGNHPSTYSPLHGVNSAYYAIGEALVSYEDIRSDIRFFNELEHGFHALGWDVMFLCDEFNDTGLICEEVCWLGDADALHDPPGPEVGTPTIYFRPSKIFEGMGWLEDCSATELAMLHFNYMKGKSAYFARGERGYGTSIASICGIETLVEEYDKKLGR